MANLIGQRLLDRYLADPPTATLEQLDAALAKGWVTQDEYDAVIALHELDEGGEA